MKPDYKKTILEDEGLRLKVYKCPAGKLTIGVGRNLEDNGITETEAIYLLENDIHSAEVAAMFLVKGFYNLTANRQIVLVSMVFQMGREGFYKFKKMIAAINEEDFETASKEMLDSKWADQTPKRAKRLAKMMANG